MNSQSLKEGNAPDLDVISLRVRRSGSNNPFFRAFPQVHFRAAISQMPNSHPRHQRDLIFLVGNIDIRKVNIGYSN